MTLPFFFLLVTIWRRGNTSQRQHVIFLRFVGVVVAIISGNTSIPSRFLVMVTLNAQAVQEEDGTVRP